MKLLIVAFAIFVALVVADPHGHGHGHGRGRGRGRGGHRGHHEHPQPDNSTDQQPEVQGLQSPRIWEIIAQEINQAVGEARNSSDAVPTAANSTDEGY
uniref:Putative salivary serine/proline-rich mucin n=1 Tax=Toxorhynchites amboinensis TaxID=46208 RepID=A0FIU8_TOXAM|nr:putative salivary serine/proline-rich mucin [Toxorhynchites amboinensis]